MIQRLISCSLIFTVSATVISAAETVYMVKNGHEVWQLHPTLERIDDSAGPKTLAASGPNLFMVKNQTEVWRLRPSLKELDRSEGKKHIVACNGRLYMFKKNKELWEFNGDAVKRIDDAEYGFESYAAVNGYFYAVKRLTNDLTSGGKNFEIVRYFPTKQIEATSTNNWIRADGKYVYFMSGDSNTGIAVYESPTDSSGQPKKLYDYTDAGRIATLTAASGNLYLYRGSRREFMRLKPKIESLHQTQSYQHLSMAAVNDRLFMVKKGNEVWRVLPDLRSIDASKGAKVLVPFSESLFVIKKGNEIWQLPLNGDSLKEVDLSSTPKVLFASDDRIHGHL